MKVFLVGDGSLARELAARARDAGHALVPRFLDDEDNTAQAATVVPDGVALAVEAVIGDLDRKRETIVALDRALPAGVPLLTAALNASATEVASWCATPQRVFGFATLPPLADATLIETMAPPGSSAATIAAARDFWATLGWKAVGVADSVGGVLPRIVCNLVNEAALALSEGVASAEDIDLAMRLGTNWPRGPLAWADLIGAASVVAVLEALGRAFGDETYQPAPLLREMARTGQRFHTETSTASTTEYTEKRRRNGGDGEDGR